MGTVKKHIIRNGVVRGSSETKSSQATAQSLNNYPENNSSNGTKSLYEIYLSGQEDSAMKNVRKLLNIEHLSSADTFTRNSQYYNRFKLPTLNDAFQKGFAHVFFTKPQCNLDKKDPTVAYAMQHNAELVSQLTSSDSNDFMLYLSNKASSFSLSDEYIESDVYGKTWGGWKIALGRNNIDSKSAGEFTITYKDDRDLNTYLLHKMWVEYIAGVYDGRFSPLSTYVENRIIDYASSCYYIITAEDGETIIFWSKYYGIFPTTIPSSQYSWAAGNIIENPSIDITYKFSFKEDFNPLSLLELNDNARIDNGIYARIYEPAYGQVGSTWVGVPFIDTVKNNGKLVYKLRFAKKS